MAASKVQIVSQEEYLPARLKLLEKEKAWTRAKDELNKERKALPLVEVSKTYEFTSIDDSGNKTTHSLADLFEGHKQLIIYHAMFDPSWDAACPNCSEFLGGLLDPSHLAKDDIGYVVVSRAPIEKIEAFRKSKGWNSFKWYSSYDSDFNYDYQATVDPSKGSNMYNFRDVDEWKRLKKGWFARGEQPGHSAFVRGNSEEGIGEDGKVYHNYSTYGRGQETVITVLGWVDMTFIGRTR